MIKGIGIDIIEIDRIRKALEKRDSFITRIFTNKEDILFKSSNYRIETIAGNFAAKEAISKALGTGIVFSWKDIEILRDENGKPYANLDGTAKKIFDEKGCSNLQISISHSNKNAIANCIIE
jgi:holo-[acyl-carrier protein] synthase